MITHRIANDIHGERQRQIERRLRLRRNDRAAPIPRLSFRKRVGHGLIHVGWMLAADGPLPDAEAPGGSPQAAHGFATGDTTVIALTREARASYAFVERNFNLTKRYLGWEIAFLVYAVAGALSVSLIGQSVGSTRLLMLLVVGAVFWNYLSVVFQSIGDTITWERWEGTLEYTMMAPVRRSVQLLGSALYAVIYGLIHTTILLIVLALFFSLDLGRANIGAAALFMAVGSASFVGIGMLAAILPMMSVERGSQMVFVLQSCLLLISGVTQ
ncbi:MAG: ABC transporter permease [Candidatus Limnocylindrales bacterium]